MKVHYSLDENNFLHLQLYIASKSKTIIIKRKIAVWALPIIYFIFAIPFLFSNYIVSIAFIAIGILWIFLYPIRQKRRYINHYKRFIQENYSKRFGKELSVEITSDCFYLKSGESESKFSVKEIEEINETPNSVLVKLSNAQYIIFPKNNIQEIESLKTELKKIAAYLQIKYNDENKWVWK